MLMTQMMRKQEYGVNHTIYTITFLYTILMYLEDLGLNVKEDLIWNLKCLFSHFRVLVDLAQETFFIVLYFFLLWLFSFLMISLLMVIFSIFLSYDFFCLWAYTYQVWVDFVDWFIVIGLIVIVLLNIIENFVIFNLCFFGCYLLKPWFLVLI